ncbi:MAG: galactose-1-phosphate uridylyltransferase [Proteobacteria bacterium]|nr:galactose-1-phosphate uridylyltransferase [Pseudomonadota bacterium]
MPELRKDPVANRWVIISSERAQRPHAFVTPKVEKKVGFCPFDYGNEHITPNEILAIRPFGTPKNSPNWTLRVVPNKFPALRIEGDLNREGDGVYDKMNGIGAHEVIIETPNHDDTLSTIDIKKFRDVLWAYKERMNDLKRDIRFKYVLVFKNHGEQAGASLSHSHSQLIALPIVPKRVLEEIESCSRYYNFKERCLICDIVRQEIQQGERLVAENKDFLAFCPYAPRFPFEVWLLPKKHESSYEKIDDSLLESLANLFKIVLQRLDVVLEEPPYNFVLHTAPFTDIHSNYYHWHFEIIPKLTKVAGFEWGSGFYINPTPPEEAAKYLREL